MKRFLSLLAVGTLSIGLANDASAQSRDLGARRLILDDGSGGRLTISYAGPGPGTFVIPSGGGSLNPNGTVLNSTLSWNGTAWTENSNVLAPVAGGLSITGAPLASNSTVSITAGVGGTDGTYYGVNSAISTGTGGVFNLVAVRGISSGTDDLSIGGQFGASGGATNIGVQVLSGGINNTGGLENNGGGITNAGTITGTTLIDAAGLGNALTVKAGDFIGGGSLNLTGGNGFFGGGTVTISGGSSIGGIAPVNINTGGGDVSIGDGTGAFTLNSANIDISAGSISGATGISSSGTITFSAISDGFVTATGGVLGSVTGIDLTTDVTGILPIANGGTGVDASATAANLVFASPDGAPGAPTFRALVAADIPAGSTNYIHNDVAQQGSANFNIDGNGTVGGTMTAATFNSTNDYQINGNNVLGITAITSTRVGQGAGQNITGQFNTVVGFQAGRDITSGVSNTVLGENAGFVITNQASNTYLGRDAGHRNVGTGNTAVGAYAGYNITNDATLGGDENTFIGLNAGFTTTTGANNVFVGNEAGYDNTSGSSNTYLGDNADGVAAGTNQTAIGQGAVATANNQVVLGNGSVTEVTTAGAINSATGYRVAGAAASGNYLRGNGTNFVSSAIQASDVPDLAVGGDLTGTISTAQIAASAVGTTEIADGTVANGDLVNSSLTVTAGTGLSGGGAVSLGGSTTLDVDFSEFDTDDLNEGATNLFFTSARVQAEGVGGDLSGTVGNATVNSFGGTPFGTMAGQDAGAVSITGGSITGITDLAVADGGTGASTFTEGGVLIGDGTNPIATVTPNTSLTPLVLTQVGDGAGNVVSTTWEPAATTVTAGNGLNESPAGTFNIDFTEFDTDDITEGASNLYYTDARVALVSVGGDLTGTVGTADIAGDAVGTAEIADGSVAYADIQDVADATLLGNNSGAAAPVSEITLGNGLEFSGSTLQIDDAVVATETDLSNAITAASGDYLLLDGTSTMGGNLAMGGFSINAAENLTANGDVSLGTDNADNIDLNGSIRGTLKFDDGMDGDRFVIAVPDPIGTGTQTYTVPDVVANATFALTTGGGASIFTGPLALRTFTLPDADATIATSTTALMLTNTASQNVQMNDGANTTLSLTNTGAGTASLTADGDIAATGDLSANTLSATGANKFAGKVTLDATDFDGLGNTVITNSSAQSGSAIIVTSSGFSDGSGYTNVSIESVNDGVSFTVHFDSWPVAAETIDLHYIIVN